MAFETFLPDWPVPPALSGPACVVSESIRLLVSLSKGAPPAWKMPPTTFVEPGTWLGDCLSHPEVTLPGKSSSLSLFASSELQGK